MVYPITNRPAFRGILILLTILLSFPLYAGGIGERSNEDNNAVSSALPVKGIVLFSTGLGYFQRAGEVYGNETVDLLFENRDINDLPKSMYPYRVPVFPAPVTVLSSLTSIQMRWNSG